MQDLFLIRLQCLEAVKIIIWKHSFSPVEMSERKYMFILHLSICRIFILNIRRTSQLTIT